MKENDKDENQLITLYVDKAIYKELEERNLDVYAMSLDDLDVIPQKGNIVDFILHEQKGNPNASYVDKFINKIYPMIVNDKICYICEFE